MELISESVKDTIRKVADKIRELRNEKGISAREMSLELGQNVNYINLIENGKRKPSLDMFLSICEYLKVEPATFFIKTTTEDKNEDCSIINETINNLTEKQKNCLEEFIKSIKDF